MTRWSPISCAPPATALGTAPRPRTLWPRVTLWLVATIILVLHAWQYLPFIEDDALISLRYARRLLDGYGLTWTDGPRVEGYSNLLWILLVATPGLFGADLVLSARVLGVVGTSAAIAAVVWEAGRSPGSPGVNPGAQQCAPEALVHQTAGPGVWGTCVAALMLALANPIAVWAIGGLEQPLLAALLAWGIVLTIPLLKPPRVAAVRILAPSLLFALACLTRPDGAIFAAAAALAILIVHRPLRAPLRTITILVSLPVLFCAGQLAFRLAYYGEWVPNTALVKLTPSLHHFAGGGRYLLNGLLALTPLSWLALLFLLIGLFKRSERRRMCFLLVLGGAWAGYLVFIGGDIFPSWRHGIPLVLLFAMILARGVSWLTPYARDAGWKGLGILVTIGLFTWFVQEQRSTARLNRWLMNADWQWNSQAVGLMLKQGFGDRQPLLAVSSAGALPYWSELPAIDTLGLNDHYLPRHPPADVGRGLLGHELGDGRYVLERRPDLIVFHGGGGRATGVFRSEKEMQANPQFTQMYTLVHFEARRPRRCGASVWLRRYSEKIGIRDTGDRVVIPAYLLNADPETSAYLDADGRFVVAVSSQRPAGIRDLLLESGRWRIELNPPAEISVEMRTPVDAADTLAYLGAYEFVLTGSATLPVDLFLVTERPGEVEIHEVSLIRKP